MKDTSISIKDMSRTFKYIHHLGKGVSMKDMSMRGTSVKVISMKDISRMFQYTHHLGKVNP
jgi:hypothetical protein